MRQTIAANIRRARLDRGLTQESLARAVDVGVRTYQGWEAGASVPELENFERLAIEVGLPLNWFYAEHEKAAA